MSATKEVVPGITVDSTVRDGKRTVTLDIANWSATLELSQREAVSIARALRTHGYIDRPAHQSIDREEPDEVIVQRLCENTSEPYDVKIPYGQKFVYAVELRRLGWTYNQIMARLRMSGKNVRQAFAEAGLK